jgi:hypothetical protein
MPEGLEIVTEPYKKIVIHEIIEYRLADWITMLISQASAAGGAAIPTLNWCGGVVFQIAPFNPNSEEIIREQLKGVIHYAGVFFATKTTFEREVRMQTGTVRLMDVSANQNFAKLAAILASRAQHHA